jgi:hypothetical protein
VAGGVRGAKACDAARLATDLTGGILNRARRGSFVAVGTVRAWSEPGLELRSQLVVLTAPYGAAASSRSPENGTGLPLGSLVFASGDPTIAALAELTALCTRAPWAVPCFALPAGQESLEPRLMLVTELRDRLVLVPPWSAYQPDALAHVVTCARHRAPPASNVLARWVARRLRDRDIEAPLRHQFAEALQGRPAGGDWSVASYSRLFSQYGPYTARDWRALARLCVHAQAGTLGDGDSCARLPLRAALAYARRYLGIGYQVLVQRVGWEWVLEGALRRARYV